jgi:hypothetical protein
VGGDGQRRCGGARQPRSGRRWRPMMRGR